MRKKVLGVFLAFGLCACAIQNIKTDASMFDGHSFEEVWKAAMLATTDIGFTIMNSDKDAGLIVCTKEANWALQNKPPQMNVIIQEVSTGVQVNCKYVERGQLVNLGGTPQKDMKNYLAAVHKRLEQ